MSKTISYGRQTIDRTDVEAVTEVLISDYLTQGPLVKAFEKVLCEYTGSRYAVCCSSGTSALHLACLAAGIKDGDFVITSPITFVASANSILYTGGKPLFVDIDPDTMNMDIERLEETIKVSSRVRAIVPVHFAGLPCDMERIYRIAVERDIVVIEDACHALGAMWRGEDDRWYKVGASSHSHMTVFSFHPVKAITTGEGGAVTTNDRGLYERLKTLRDHGIIREPDRFIHMDSSIEPPPWYYEMQELGFNYRLTDLQCALGISQMRRIDEFVKRREEIACLYRELLSEYPFIKTPEVDENNYRSAWHLYPVRIDFDGLGIDKGSWFRAIAERGIRLQVHYIPVHLQPYYRKRFGYTWGDFPEAERHYLEEVSLPIYPLLTDDDVKTIVKEVVTTLTCASARLSV